ncbi:MAG: hypothetical protein EBZ50_04075 [Alphaproteobacteria bacterium]|nr:hypothetical protein [Alphaproteobacteria bacterium]
MTSRAVLERRSARRDPSNDGVGVAHVAGDDQDRPIEHPSGAAARRLARGLAALGRRIELEHGAPAFGADGHRRQGVEAAADDLAVLVGEHIDALAAGGDAVDHVLVQTLQAAFAVHLRKGLELDIGAALGVTLQLPRRRYIDGEQQRESEYEENAHLRHGEAERGGPKKASKLELHASRR